MRPQCAELCAKHADDLEAKADAEHSGLEYPQVCSLDGIVPDIAIDMRSS